MSQDWLLRLYCAAHTRVGRTGRERGDVPGWVMVAIMSAGLVAAILVGAKGQVADAVSGAIDKVTGDSYGG